MVFKPVINKNDLPKAISVIFSFIAIMIVILILLVRLNPVYSDKTTREVTGTVVNAAIDRRWQRASNIMTLTLDSGEQYDYYYWNEKDFIGTTAASLTEDIIGKKATIRYLSVQKSRLVCLSFEGKEIINYELQEKDQRVGKIGALCTWSLVTLFGLIFILLKFVKLKF